MNPLRCLAQFIAFLHTRSWTGKSDLIYQFLHFTLLFGLFFAVSGIYLNSLGYTLPIETKTAILILIPVVLVVCTYLLLLGKKPYLKSEYKNSQVVVGGVVWLLLWIYIFPIFWILKD